MGWHFHKKTDAKPAPELVAKRRAELVELLGGEENYKAWLAQKLLTDYEGTFSWLVKVNWEIARLRAQRDSMAEGARLIP